MATTTKKSPKTKTTKAKAAPKKTTAKTSGAKATQATKSQKVTKPSVSKTARKVTMLSLHRINLLAALVFVALAAVAGFVMKDASFQLTLGHLAKDDLLSTDTTVFAPAVRAVFDIELRWVVVTIMALSAVFPALYASKLEKRYAQYVQGSRMLPYRWIDLGVTGALMLEVVALLSGVNDIMVLKLMGSMVLVTALLALVAERQNNTADRPVWSAYLTSVFSGVLPWILIATSAVATVVYGSVRAPWYVYALYAAFAGGWALIAVNECKQYRKRGAWANYVTVERNYAVLSMLTKAAFAVILVVGLH